MRNFIIASLSLLFYAASFGQDTAELNDRLSYGINPYVTMSTVRGINDGNRPFGIGGDIFATYRIENQYLHTKLGYKRYVYGGAKNNTVTTEDIHLLLAVKQSLSQARELNLILGYMPSYVVNASDRYNGKKDTIPTVYIQKKLTNRFSHGIYLGLEMQSKENGSLELGFTYIPNSKRTNGYFDAIPSHITMGYNFKFNTTANVPEDVLEARATLMRLRYDTLYFINRSCPDDFSKSELDSLLAQNYTYSAYKILEDSEVDKVSKQSNVVHFAIIGKHYAGLGEPETNGIYLLDSKLESTKFPYPFHTSNSKNSNGFSSCLGSLENTAALIQAFDKRLHKKNGQL